MIVKLALSFNGIVNVNGKEFYVDLNNLNLIRSNSKLKYVPLIENFHTLYLYDYKNNQLFNIAKNVDTYTVLYNYLTDDTYCIVEIRSGKKYLKQIYHITDKQNEKISLLATLYNHYVLGTTEYKLHTSSINIIMPISNYLVSYRFRFDDASKYNNCYSYIRNIHTKQWFNKIFLLVHTNFSGFEHVFELYDVVTNKLINAYIENNNYYYSVDNFGIVYRYKNGIFNALDYSKERLFLQLTYEKYHDQTILYFLRSLI